jgi:hypothetical protein
LKRQKGSDATSDQQKHLVVTHFTARHQVATSPHSSRYNGSAACKRDCHVGPGWCWEGRCWGWEGRQVFRFCVTFLFRDFVKRLPDDRSSILIFQQQL